jgi:uncharacterized membrane protein YgdD (TMEM256/DUF423 family)
LLSNEIAARILGILGSVFGLLAVALGAFGAHGLKDRLSPQELATFETGVRYQMYHALALLLVVFLIVRGGAGSSQAAGWAFVVGVLLFSGSLYLMVLTGARWLGPVTPIGGVAFLVGWLLLGLSFFKN